MSATAPSIDLDDTRWPLIVITFRGVPTDRELEAYLDAHLRIVARRSKIAVVVDAMEAGQVPSMHRKRIADWMTCNDQLLTAYTVGSSFAFSSRLVRGTLTAILWLQPLSHPHYIAASRPDAERWAIARLAACGLDVPSSPELPAPRSEVA